MRYVLGIRCCCEIISKPTGAQSIFPYCTSPAMAPSPHGPVTLSHPTTWNFDIDRYLNPFVPAPRWHLVPRPIAHMLGYRDRPPKPIGNIVVALWSLLGAFCGVALIASVTKRVPSFEARDATAIIGSFVSRVGSECVRAE